MAVYNTPSDSANTAVRAFLTKVGEFYLGHSFNTGSGKGKEIWLRIKKEVFNSSCAYCGQTKEKLQIEHLYMFNRSEYGLHHPGNTVPCCTECNTRAKKEDKTYTDWLEHLKIVCQKRGDESVFETRKQKILKHIESFNYPMLSDSEKQAIKVIANSLYDNIKAESDKSLNLYKELDKAFVKPVEVS